MKNRAVWLLVVLPVGCVLAAILALLAVAIQPDLLALPTPTPTPSPTPVPTPTQAFSCLDTPFYPIGATVEFNFTERGKITAYIKDTGKGWVAIQERVVRVGEEIVGKLSNDQWMAVGQVLAVYSDGIDVCVYSPARQIDPPAWADQLEP